MSEPCIYQIKVKGQLIPEWTEWFDGMTLSSPMDDDGTPITTLTGPVADQAALRGVLTRVWDLNLRVISVIAVDPEKER